MRKRIMVIIAVALTVCFLSTVVILDSEPDRCPLCQFIKSHAPCIVNIETGDVVELALYQPHYTLVGEIAEIQNDSTFSFVSAAGAKGTRISSPYKMELEVPVISEPMYKTYFCKKCRRLLSGYGHGYVLADLYDRGNPVIYAIEEGMDTSIRCYDASVTYNKEKNVFDLLIEGTYHGSEH